MNDTVMLNTGDEVRIDDYVKEKSAKLITEGFSYATEAEVRDQLNKVLDGLNGMDRYVMAALKVGRHNIPGLSIIGMYIQDDII